MPLDQTTQLKDDAALTVLRDADAMLAEPCDWVQNDYVTNRGQCLMGALNWYQPFPLGDSHPIYIAAIHLANALPSDFDDLHNRDGEIDLYATIAQFNDHERTTFAVVKGAIKRAIKTRLAEL